jgi:hypothetical protein
VKKLLIGLLALVFLVGCAAPDRNTDVGRVAQFGWTKLRDDVDSYTAYDTLAFDLRHYRGAVTYWLDPDTSSATAAANLPDSCMTIYIELYNDETAEWGKYYSGVTKLDTIDRAVANVAAADADVYIPLAKFNADQFAWADRARIIEYVGVGNKHGGARYIGGQ